MRNAHLWVQIGWLTEAIDGEGDLEDYLAGLTNGFGPDLSPLDEYDGTEHIEHSHGPITRPIPVYVALDQDHSVMRGGNGAEWSPGD